MKINPYSVLVRFSDCDMMGHVNNASFLNYFEDARIHYLKSLFPEWDWKKKGIILRKNIIEYLSPLYLEDKPIVYVFLSKIGTKSFILNYEVFVNEDLKATGESVLVCFDFFAQKSVNVYKDWIYSLNLLKK